MPLNRQIREQIDSCRPGKDDLALPALADLAAALPGDASLRDELERSRRFDQAVTAALNDLPVPAGLAERLLAAAAERVNREDVGDADFDDNESTKGAKVAAELAARAGTRLGSGRLSRRAWSYAAAAAAGMLLAGSLGMWLWPRSPRLITADELAANLESWVQAAAKGRTVTKLPRGYAPPAAVGVTAWSYRQFTTPQGWPAIAAIPAPPAVPSATLLIIRTRAKTKLTAVPLSLSASGGRAAAAWQVGDLVYVLVVERGQRIEDYLPPPRTQA